MTPRRQWKPSPSSSPRTSTKHAPSGRLSATGEHFVAPIHPRLPGKAGAEGQAEMLRARPGGAWPKRADKRRRSPTRADERSPRRGRSVLLNQPPRRRGLVAALLEGGYLVHLAQEAEGFAEGLEGPPHYPRRVPQHVPCHPPRQVRGSLGEVARILGVDVLRVDPGGAAVDAPACADVLGEVEELVWPVDPAGRAGEYGVSLYLQRAAPFTKAATGPDPRRLTLILPEMAPRKGAICAQKPVILRPVPAPGRRARRRGGRRAPLRGRGGRNPNPPR